MSDGRAGPPRLLVLNQYYDTVEASGQVLRQLCEELAPDFEVEVVSAPPPDPAGSVARARAKGVKLDLVRTTRFGKASLVLRIVNYLTFMLGVALRGLRAGRPDVVLCFTDPPVVGLLGAAVARARRARFVVVMQDVHPEVGMISGALTNPVAVKILGLSQRLILKGADRVVVISAAMRDQLVDRGASADAVAVIPNWADIDHLPAAPRENPWGVENELERGFVLMHAGNVGILQSLDTLLAAAAQLPDVHIVIVGEGSRKDELMREATQRNLGNVRFVPFQPREDLPEVLASADVHLVSLKAGLAGFIEPSKVYGAMASERPVVAAIDEGTETARLVRESGCGVVVPPGDVDALVAAIEQMRELPPGERVEMGRAGRAYVSAHCGLDTAAHSYRHLLDGLLGAGR